MMPWVQHEEKGCGSVPTTDPEQLTCNRVAPLIVGTEILALAGGTGAVRNTCRDLPLVPENLITRFTANTKAGYEMPTNAVDQL